MRTSCKSLLNRRLLRVMFFPFVLFFFSKTKLFCDALLVEDRKAICTRTHCDLL